MGTWKVANRVSALIPFVFVVFPFSANAQRTTTTVDDCMQYERDFLHAFYPELSGKKYWITFETWDGYEKLAGYEHAGKNFLVDVGDGPKSSVQMCCIHSTMRGVIGGLPPSTPPPPKIQKEKPLNLDSRGALHPTQYLSTNFIFDFEGRLTHFFWGKENSDAYSNLAQKRRLNSNMSDAELKTAYTESGAKYTLGD